MSSKSRARARSSHPLWAFLLLTLLLVGTAGLTVAAIAHGQPTAAIASPAPSSTPTPEPTEKSTATPTPSPLKVAAVPRAQERFLLFDADGTAWRAVAGSCVSGEPPLLERSPDGGLTWSDVTPRYLGIAQIAALVPFTPGQAEVIAGVGVDCAVQGLRTYTQGAFWESYPQVLDGVSYLPPTDPAATVTPLGAPPAPCADPTSLSVADESAALICGTTPYVWVASTATDWIEIAAAPARAALVAGDTLTLARITLDCPGIAFSTMSVADLSAFQTVCRPDIDRASAIALAQNLEGIAAWSGATVVTVD